MPSKTFIGKTEDGQLAECTHYIGTYPYGHVEPYIDAHHRLTAVEKFDYVDYLHIGHSLESPVDHPEIVYKCCRRCFVFFDTREIPPEATITRAVLSLKGYAMGGTFPPFFFVQVQKGVTPEYPHMPLLYSDYDYTKYEGNGGKLTSFDTGYNDIELNAEGLTFLNKGGMTKLVLRTDQEIAANEPTKDGHYWFSASERVGEEPKLYVEWTVPVPKHTLTITATAGGTTDPTPGAYEHDEGSVVSVAAISHSGYVFDHWELDGADVGSATPYDVTMDTDHTLHAVFAEAPEPPPGKHNLTITATVGGTTLPPVGVHEYDEGLPVEVLASAIPEYKFSHWLLDTATHTENPITVTMDTDHSLHAVFTPFPPLPPEVAVEPIIIAVAIEGAALAVIILWSFLRG